MGCCWLLRSLELAEAYRSCWREEVSQDQPESFNIFKILNGPHTAVYVADVVGRANRALGALARPPRAVH